MKDPAKHFLPKGARYPIFFLGLLVIIVGGIGTVQLNLPLISTVVAGAVGFLLLAISVILR